MSRPSGLATPLATFARNFVLAIPTVIGSPTRSRTAHRNCSATSVGVPESRLSPRTSRNASSIDSPSTDRSWTQATGSRDAHRRADAVRLRLITGREYNPGADDHRPSTQVRVISLLDRRKERVDVGMENGRLFRHEHMFARRTDVFQPARASAGCAPGPGEPRRFRRWLWPALAARPEAAPSARQGRSARHPLRGGARRL
jgi:hypothetical protein